MRKIASIIFLMSSLLFYSQKEASNWCFGSHAGIKFNNDGTVTSFSGSAINTSFGCSTISDCDGNLLFYTDGITVWNKNHTQMVNGFGLKGNDSSTQSATILKQPGSANIFYIFTAGYTNNLWSGDTSLNYSIVDMSLNSGLGEVTLKNNLLLSDAPNRVCIVKKNDENAFWVLAIDNSNDSFASFFVDSSGVNTTPVMSAISNFSNGMAGGYLKASSDGKKIAKCSSVNGDVCYYDFDSSSGIVYNQQIIYSVVVDLYNLTVLIPFGVEFSQDNKLLYVSCFSDKESKIFQFDLTSNAISNSIFDVYGIVNPADTIFSLQMGLDNKIYCSINTSKYLALINNPNQLGSSCSFVENAVYLGGIPHCNAGLPSFPNSYLNNFIVANNLCHGTYTQFTLNGYSSLPPSVYWDFGDGTTSTLFNPSHLYLNSGDYTVTLHGLADDCGGIISKKITIQETPIYNSVSNQNICGSQNMEYDLSPLSSIALGSQSSTLFGVKYYLTQNDLNAGINEVSKINLNLGVNTVYVKVYNIYASCYSAGQFEVICFQKPELLLDEKYILCLGSSLNISVPNNFTSYEWSNGSTISSTIINSPGNYQVTVANSNCSLTKSFMVTQSDSATITDVSVNDFNDNNTIEVFVKGIGDYEYSINGINYQESNVFDSVLAGEYIVWVRDKNGCGVATRDAVVLIYPKYFTPNGDGYNDRWQINFSKYYPEMTISIYDRFSKNLYSFKGKGLGWDGTYNGQLMPSDDYWFEIKKENGQSIKGHFSLKR